MVLSVTVLFIWLEGEHIPTLLYPLSCELLMYIFIPNMVAGEGFVWVPEHCFQLMECHEKKKRKQFSSDKDVYFCTNKELEKDNMNLEASPLLFLHSPLHLQLSIKAWNVSSCVKQTSWNISKLTFSRNVSFFFLFLPWHKGRRNAKLETSPPSTPRSTFCASIIVLLFCLSGNSRVGGRKLNFNKLHQSSSGSL